MLKMIDKDRLREQMQLCGFSQASLAAKIGVSPASIQQILNGSTKQPRSIRKIAAALDVKEDWLEGLSDFKTREIILEYNKGDSQPIIVPYFDKGIEISSRKENTPVSHRNLLIGSSWLEKISGGKAEGIFMYRMPYNDMAPTVMMNDDVLVNICEQFDGDNGSMWLLINGDHYQTRRLRRRSSSKIEVSADNPLIQTVEMLEDELALIGKLIWQGRPLSHS